MQISPQYSVATGRAGRRPDPLLGVQSLRSRDRSASSRGEQIHRLERVPPDVRPGCAARCDVQKETLPCNEVGEDTRGSHGTLIAAERAIRKKCAEDPERQKVAKVR